MRRFFSRRKQEELAREWVRSQTRKDEFHAESQPARDLLERVMAQPRDVQQEQANLIVQRRGSILRQRRTQFVMALSIIVIGGFVGLNVLSHRGNGPQDLLTRAQAEYGDIEGIVYVKGRSSDYHSYEAPNHKPQVYQRKDRLVELWGTSDGLYQRQIVTNSPGDRWEFLWTPDGNCYASSNQLGNVQYGNDKHLRYIGSLSCPFGLGLRPRQHKRKYPKGQPHQEEAGNGLSPTVREALLHTGKLLRRILAGKFTRHSVEEFVEDGREVYRVKAWRPALVYEAVGKPVLSDKDFTVETLILDKKTLRLKRYEERTQTSELTGEKSLTVLRFVLDAPIRVFPETKENFALLQLQFAPSRVDKNPFGRDDLELDKRIKEHIRQTIGRQWIIKQFVRKHHRKPTEAEIRAEGRRLDRANKVAARARLKRLREEEKKRLQILKILKKQKKH